MAAALDAVKEHAKLPWTVPRNDAALEPEASTTNEEVHRVLRSYHFEKALKEITPSASEQLGTLADLRKWNEEFGEGGLKRGKRIWGGKFGFIVKGDDKVIEEGRVQNQTKA